MTEDELIRRLRAPEDGFVERKAVFDSREIREALVAFANSDSERLGVIFVGVNPDGSIRGVEDPDSLSRGRLDKICTEDCFPPIRYTTVSLDLPGGKVLAIVVPPSLNRPHFAGHAFIRVGSQTKKASTEAFEHLIASRLSKAGALLRLRGQTITIRINRKATEGRNMFAYLRQEFEAQVEACDTHCVTVRLISSGTSMVEPLEWVLISKDPSRNRPLLIVSRS